MRKHITSGDFKGSVFLELDSPAEAEALMAKELVHDGAKLVRMCFARALREAVWAERVVGAAQVCEWRANYTARKVQERRERPNALPYTGAPRAAAVAAASPPPADNLPRFKPGTVLAFALGAAAHARGLCAPPDAALKRRAPARAQLRTPTRR